MITRNDKRLGVGSRSVRYGNCNGCLKMLKPTRVLLTLVLCLGVARLQAQDRFAARDEATTLLVTSALITADQKTIVITGEDFGRLPPRVTLGSTQLAGVTVDPTGTILTAVLPPATPPATYALSITRRSWPIQSLATVVTIGAQGPKGDAGLQGPAGLRRVRGVTSARKDRRVRKARGATPVRRGRRVCKV